MTKSATVLLSVSGRSVTAAVRGGSDFEVLYLASDEQGQSLALDAALLLVHQSIGGFASHYMIVQDCASSVSGGVVPQAGQSVNQDRFGSVSS